MNRLLTSLSVLFLFSPAALAGGIDDLQAELTATQADALVHQTNIVQIVNAMTDEELQAAKKLSNPVTQGPVLLDLVAALEYVQEFSETAANAIEATKEHK